MTVDTMFASKLRGASLKAGNYQISALAFFALSFFATGLNAATWTVKHLTGDEDSGFPPSEFTRARSTSTERRTKLSTA